MIGSSFVRQSIPFSKTIINRQKQEVYAIEIFTKVHAYKENVKYNNSKTGFNLYPFAVLFERMFLSLGAKYLYHTKLYIDGYYIWRMAALVY